MNIENNKKKILQLFKDRGVEANEFYPLSEFMRATGIPGDRTYVAAVEELQEAGLLEECLNAMQLTEKGAEAIEKL